jgi:pilus assembly protein CpaF
MSGLNIPNEAIRRYVSAAIHVIIHVSRQVDGSRKLISLQEISGMEGNIISMQEIFSFKQSGVDENGMVKGRFETCRIMPKFLQKFEAYGVSIPQDIFDPSKVHEI